MNHLVNETDDQTVLPNSGEVLPFDAGYPIALLSTGLKAELERAETAARDVYLAVVKEAPQLAQIHQATKKGCRYVVDATESTIEAIESGKIKLTMEKRGKIFAQIREANGHYGSKLPIKRESFRKGVDPVQMANALQVKALQEQVQSITEQISIIDHSVKEVLQGQQNDRIGLYYSGLALYIEARNTVDEDLKKALIAQALRSLSESTFQLVLTMQADIQYLVDKQYNAAKGKRVELIDSRMRSINQSFAYIHQATMLRAGIFCNQGEVQAMSAVLEEYSRFVDGTVAKNASFLAQCDIADDGTEAGVWKTRSKLKLDVSEFAKQINAPQKIVYLSMSKENESWEKSKDA